MQRSMPLVLIAAATLALFVEFGAVRVPDRAGTPEDRSRAAPDRGPITPIEQPVDLDPEVVALGRRLFEDRRLSADRSMSCASCHRLDHAGTDGRKTSVGANGVVGRRNTPTVWNTDLHTVWFWDGRAASLEDQAGVPLVHPDEMGNDWDTILRRLRGDAEYRRSFAANFPDGITEHNVRRALAEFERSLRTLDAPFDRYLNGDTGAISAEAERGYELFLDLGCIACHQGAAVGGNLFQRVGIVHTYVPDTTADGPDLGRFEITGREQDRFLFKVPSLRHASQTAPYLHDGSVATLEEVIRRMAWHQLGTVLEPAQVRQIIAFLDSLAGTPPR